MSEVDHTPAWLEFLKKPENLMTGIVLLAGLTQDRRPGQSRMDQLGQAALGSLAFRGGLDYGVQQQQMKQQEQRSQQDYRKGQLDLGREQIETTRSEGAANRAHATQQTDRQIQGQKDLRGIPQAQTPEQQAYTRALAGYYNRMPQGAGGSGKGMVDPVGGDLYEQEMFKQWAAAEMAQAQMTGQPFVMDPMKWSTYIQPYRNAKIVLRQLESQNIPGEVYKDDKGQWRVRVAGVTDPVPGAGPPPAPGAASGGAESPTPANPPPVELTPPPNPLSLSNDPAIKQGLLAEAKNRAPDNPKALDKARADLYAEKMAGLDRLGLEKLLRAKDTDTGLARAIRKRLAELSREETRARMKAHRGE